MAVSRVESLLTHCDSHYLYYNYKYVGISSVSNKQCQNIFYPQTCLLKNYKAERDI